MVPLLLYTSLDYKLAEILGNTKADLAKNKLIWTNENNIGNIKAQVMSKDIDYIYNPTTNTPEYGPYNTEFKINDYIPANGADKDTPLFVVVDPPKYTGTGTINIEANNSTFYGAIYAPYAQYTHFTINTLYQQLIHCRKHSADSLSFYFIQSIFKRLCAFFR